jgi:hypothetical protein
MEIFYETLNCVHVCVFSLMARERMNWFPPNLACLFLETRKRFYSGKNLEKSWIRVPVRTISVVRKVSTTEEGPQGQSCVFRKRSLQKQRLQPQKCVLGPSSGEHICVPWKLTTVDQYCMSGQGDLRNTDHKHKNLSRQVPVKFSVTLETNDNWRRRYIKTVLFVLARRLQEQNAITLKMWPGIEF